MQAQEVFYYTASAAFSILAVLLGIILFFTIRILWRVDKAIHKIDVLTGQGKLVGSGLIRGALSLFSRFGGENMARTKKINPFAAGAVGAVVGAIGGATAAAMAMSDKTTRKKITDTASGLVSNVRGKTIAKKVR